MTGPVGMSLFLSGVLSGSPSSKKRHLNQAIAMQKAIQERWHNATPWKWKLKHVKWFLNVFLANHAPSTRYRYVLTTQLILKRMDKNWGPLLGFPPQDKPFCGVNES